MGKRNDYFSGLVYFIFLFWVLTKKGAREMILDDMIACANRYRWLRKEFAEGRETYLAEGIPSEDELDRYIDEQLRKAQEK